MILYGFYRLDLGLLVTLQCLKRPWDYFWSVRVFKQIRVQGRPGFA